MESIEIRGHIVEYLDEEHIYLVDGIELPSVTTLLKEKFSDKYSYVNPLVLKKAAEKGTEVHKAIEDYCREGIESDLEELRNFKFLKKYYGFNVIDNEVPIIIFKNENPVACGRLDLVIQMEEKLMLADIKRTSVLDKEYLKYQLNLYKIGFEQCYGKKIEGLRGIHLREDKRKFIEIPMDQKYSEEILEFI